MATWTTADGRKISVLCMSTEHLYNIKRNFKKVEDKTRVQPIIDEIERRKKVLAEKRSAKQS